MIACTTKVCVRNAVNLCGLAPRPMTSSFSDSASRGPSSFRSICIYFKPKYTASLVTKSSSFHSNVQLQIPQATCSDICIDCQKNNPSFVTIKTTVRPRGSWKRRVEALSACQKVSAQVLRRVTFGTGAQTLSPRLSSSATLMGGMLVLLSNSDPVQAETSREKQNVDDSSEVRTSHGKKVHTDYSITGIPGDGRCLFRSVVHGACLQSGKPPPSESLQRELADELRERVRLCSMKIQVK